MVGGPLDPAAHLRHEGLFAFLVRAIVLKPAVNAHREDLRLGGDTDEARSHLLGQLLRRDRTGDGRAVFADVDAPVGVFTAQVDAGQHDGPVRALKVLIAGGDARVDDRDRHATASRDLPGTTHSHGVEDGGRLLDVGGRVLRAFAALRFTCRRRRRRRGSRRRSRTHARGRHRVRVGDAGAERTGVLGRDDRRGDGHERESSDQRGPDEASAQRPGTRAAAHLSPTEAAAAFGDISEPGGMSSPHARGTDAASDALQPRAFMETDGTSPRE